MNASHLQVFQQMLINHSPITTMDVYSRLANPGGNIYADIKHVIRKEVFNYLPPFKASLLSLGLNYSVYKEIICSAKKSGDYDFIVVDTDVTFDEAKTELIGVADRVIVVTKQSMASVVATNILVSNINGVSKEKFVFVCNDFVKEEDNALISPNIALKFSVTDYIEHIRRYDSMKPEQLSAEGGIQRTAFLIL